MNNDDTLNDTNLQLSCVQVLSWNTEQICFVFLTVCSDWLSGDNNLAKYFDKEYDAVPIFNTIGPREVQ